MGITERKKREKKLRQEQILNAAIDLISTQGFEKTTMDEIAERAELSKGTLYVYFNDKSSLYQGIKKRGLSRLKKQYSGILQEDIAGAELVKKMAGSFLNFIQEHAIFIEALTLCKSGNGTEESKSINDCTQIESELLMLITRALQIGVQDGSIRSSVPPKILALQISFEMRGILHFFLTSSQDHVFKMLQENHMTMAEMMDQFLSVHLNQPETNPTKIRIAK